MECPKCGYIRKATDPFPEYECPVCRVIYSKYKGPSTFTPNEETRPKGRWFPKKLRLFR